MDAIRFAIDRPIAVVAVVLIAVLFGVLSLSRIPVQLAPDVRKPIVVVETSWPGAAPSEIEREIVNLQEEALRGLEGLEVMTSRSQTGEAEVTLEFAVGSDMSDVLLLVSNRLDRVSGYPDEANEPTLNTSGSDDSPIAWVVLTAAEGNTREMGTYRDFIEDTVQDRVERIEGVSAVNLFGGVTRELQIVVDPLRLSRFNLTVPEIVRTLRAENISISAGDLDEGKRRYVVRTEGNLNTEDAIRDVVLRSGAASGGIGQVRVSDVAEVAFAYSEPTSRLRFRGEPGLAFNIVREAGANVISTMEDVRATLEELNAGPVADAGLLMEQVYDETIYIDGAIDLVTQNIYIGGLLAALILMLFLRSPRATVVVSLS
ncbi:MAG: efflux RND transporter permease subunit, partial [Pseudomonadota bacterium]